MDKIRKTGIMKKVNKDQICQNLSKYQDRILCLSRRGVHNRRIVSPSPFFLNRYIAIRCDLFTPFSFICFFLFLRRYLLLNLSENMFLVVFLNQGMLKILGATSLL